MWKSNQLLDKIDKTQVLFGGENQEYGTETSDLSPNEKEKTICWWLIFSSLPRRTNDGIWTGMNMYGCQWWRYIKVLVSGWCLMEGECWLFGAWGNYMYMWVVEARIFSGVWRWRFSLCFDFQWNWKSNWNLLCFVLFCCW